MNSFLQLPNCWTKRKPCSPVGNVNHDLPCVFPAEDALVRDASPELLIEEIRLEKSMDEKQLRWSWFLTGPSRFFWMYIIMIVIYPRSRRHCIVAPRFWWGRTMERPTKTLDSGWDQLKLDPHPNFVSRAFLRRGEGWRESSGNEVAHIQ